MAGFSTDVLKVATSDGLNVTLLEGFSFTDDTGTYVVPAGSTSDGFSTPQAIWNLIPPFGKGWKAAVLHDWAYRYSSLPKDQCDALLKSGMRACGMGEFEIELIYKAVSDWGEDAFVTDRKAQATAAAS